MSTIEQAGRSLIQNYFMSTIEQAGLMT